MTEIQMPDLTALETIAQNPPIHLKGGERVIVQVDSILIPKSIARAVFQLLGASLANIPNSFEAMEGLLTDALVYIPESASAEFKDVLKEVQKSRKTVAESLSPEMLAQFKM